MVDDQAGLKRSPLKVDCDIRHKEFLLRISICLTMFKVSDDELAVMKSQPRILLDQ